MKCLCSSHRSEGGHSLSWSCPCSCMLYQHLPAATQDSASPALWKPSPSFILTAQILQRLLQQQWLSQKAQVMHIDTHCVYERHVPVSCSLQKNSGVGHYKSTLAWYFFNAQTKFQVIYNVRKYICNTEIINLITRVLVSTRTQKHEIHWLGICRDRGLLTPWASGAHTAPAGSNNLPVHSHSALGLRREA